MAELLEKHMRKAARIKRDRIRKAENRKRQEYSNIVSVLSAIREQLEIDEEDRGRNEANKARRETTGIVLVCLTLIATGIAAYASIRLADLTRIAVEYSRKAAANTSRDDSATFNQTKLNNDIQARQTAVALKIANDNAVTAGKQLETAQDTAIKDLRPYVDFTAADPSGATHEPIFKTTDNLNRPLQAGIFVKNFGKTPAYNLIVSSGMNIYDANTINSPKGEFSETVHSKGSHLAPGDFNWQNQHLNRAINRLEWERMLNNSAAAVFVATINYDDGFGQHYYSRYCVWYTPLTSPEGTMCPGHNDSK